MWSSDLAVEKPLPHAAAPCQVRGMREGELDKPKLEDFGLEEEDK